MSLAFVDKNKDWKNIQELLKNLKKTVLTVGIQKNAGVDDKGNSIAEYGTYNEFGTVAGKVRIPARSFLRSTTDENDGWKKDIDEAYTDILEGKSTIKTAMTTIGVKARDDIVKKINDGDPTWAPNADSTIRKKKSSKPLIDKGFLKNAIQYAYTVGQAFEKDV